jgi:hypothetical protein
MLSHSEIKAIEGTEDAPKLLVFWFCCCVNLNDAPDNVAAYQRAATSIGFLIELPIIMVNLFLLASLLKIDSLIYFILLFFIMIFIWIYILNARFKLLSKLFFSIAKTDVRMKTELLFKRSPMIGYVCALSSTLFMIIWGISFIIGFPVLLFGE